MFFGFTDDSTLSKLNQRKIQDIECANTTYYAVVDNVPTSLQTISIDFVVQDNDILNSLITHLNNRRDEVISLVPAVGIGNTTDFKFVDYNIVSIQYFELARYSDTIKQLLSNTNDTSGVILTIEFRGYVI
ncbi:MAG: hypothetical protein QW044_01990 [Candidatus Anstonellales archaeon]